MCFLKNGQHDRKLRQFGATDLGNPIDVALAGVGCWKKKISYLMYLLKRSPYRQD